jgi:hypothetical protein
MPPRNPATINREKSLSFSNANSMFEILDLIFLTKMLLIYAPANNFQLIKT